MRATLLAAVVFGTTGQAADWPQWLGPKRDGTFDEKIAPWKSPPKLLWKKPVGIGFSSPVVSKGRVFIHARAGDDAEEVVAFDVKDGKILWNDKYTREPYRAAVGGGPAATPTVAGGRVFTFGITGTLACYQADTGKRNWLVDVYKKLGSRLPRFGACCSPLVIGDRVLVSVGGKGRSLAAFDVATGELLWQNFDDPASTGSPVLCAGQDGGDPTAVFMTSLRLIAVDPLDGKIRWETPMVFQPAGTSPTPLVIDRNIITSTMDNGTVSTQIPASPGDKVARAWQMKEFGGYFSTGVRVGNRVCVVTNVLQPLPSATLRCLDLATGKEVWNKSGVGYFHAAVFRTGDDKLVLHSDNGTLTLLESKGDKVVELCKAPICGGTLVAPAFSNGMVFSRDAVNLSCTQLNP